MFDMIFQSTDMTAKRTAVLRGLPVILGDENTDFFKTCFVSRLYYNLHHRFILFNSYVTLIALVLVTVLPLLSFKRIQLQFSNVTPCKTQMSSRTKKVQ